MEKKTTAKLDETKAAVKAAEAKVAAKVEETKTAAKEECSQRDRGKGGYKGRRTEEDSS